MVAYREESKDGWTILVGKGARQNDELSLKIAEPQDWWMHAAGYSGSHVVVRSPEGDEPPREVLQHAARLAAWHSKARGSRGKVEVHVCLARDVGKASGYPPGTVNIKRFSVIKVYSKDPNE